MLRTYGFVLSLALLVGCGVAGSGEGVGFVERDRDGGPERVGAALTTDTATEPIVLIDDAGHEVVLHTPATRVLTLAPSLTETLVALGAFGELVGRTVFDTAPELQRIPSVGDMSTPSLEAMVSLEPDLVVALRGSASETLRPRLAASGTPLFAFEISDTTDVFRTVDRLGTLVGRTRTADSLSAAIRDELTEIRHSVEDLPEPAVLYMIWHDPPIVAGPGSYIQQLVELAGGRAALPELRAPWPSVSLEGILSHDPDIVLVSIGDEPSYTVGQLRDAPGWRDLHAVREGRIYDLPVELMNRPGPHLAEAARLLRDRIHPEAAR